MREEVKVEVEVDVVHDLDSGSGGRRVPVSIFLSSDYYQISVKINDELFFFEFR
jgi:hypothetical protein